MLEKIHSLQNPTRIFECNKGNLLGCKKNTAGAFEMEGFLHDFNHGDLPITQSFTRLSGYCQQVDMYKTTIWDCPTDATKYKKVVEKKCIYKSLLALNKNLNGPYGRILAIKPLPNIQEVASEVRQKESRKKVMIASNQSTIEGSAVAARGPPYTTNDTRSRERRSWCDHCWTSSHTKDTCWKIHGKPVDR